MKTKKVIFHFETITPMFLGGAETNMPELRTAPIKGALRFWWRAMNAHLVEKKNGRWDYSKLREYESAIFGGTDSPKAQKSKVLIRIINSQLSVPKNFKKLENQSKKDLHIHNLQKNKTEQVNVIRYLGFGLYDFRNEEKNRCYVEGSWDLLCEYPEGDIITKIDNKEVTINIEKELQIAFSMLNLFGTLGSKARNGFGSIQISSKDFTLLSMDKIQEYLQQKQSFNPSSPVEGIVPYTALVRQLQIIKKGNTKTPVEALEEIAINYSNAKKNVKTNEYIAAPKIYKLSERYPKRYYFSVKKNENGNYKWQCLYLPMLIEELEHRKKYQEQNEKFQKP